MNYTGHIHSLFKFMISIFLLTKNKKKAPDVIRPITNCNQPFLTLGAYHYLILLKRSTLVNQTVLDIFHIPLSQARLSERTLVPLS